MSVLFLLVGSSMNTETFAGAAAGPDSDSVLMDPCGTRRTLLAWSTPVAHTNGPRWFLWFALSGRCQSRQPRDCRRNGRRERRQIATR